MKLALPLRIAACGWTVLTYRVLKNVRVSDRWEYQEFHRPYRMLGSMRTGELRFDNGPLTLSVDGEGRLEVTKKSTGRTYSGLLRFEDCGDCGDGWNYVAPKFDSAVFSSSAEVSVERDTSSVAVVKILQEIKIPASADGLRRSEARKVLPIETTLTMLAGSSRIQVVTRVKNGALNHRLRVLFPTGLGSRTFSTKLPFDLYDWPVEKTDNETAKERDTFVNPCQGAVVLSEGADAFAVYTKGLYEVSVADDAARTVALTLFRSFTNEVGSLNHEMPGNMLGEYRFEYELDFAESGEGAYFVRASDAFRSGLVAARTELHSGDFAREGTVVRLTGGGVLSLLENAEGNRLRLYDVSGGSSGRIGFARPVGRAFRTDLEGNVCGEMELDGGEILYRLSNREILTVSFEWREER